MFLKFTKFFLLATFCLLVRLMPFRVPNIEPLTAALMPLGRAYGGAFAFFFGVGSVLAYDALTGTMGMNTFFTATAFGLLGLAASSYFSNHKADMRGNIRFAIGGTLFFDIVTGLIPGPLLYGQSFAGALAGQLPFTALHLLGNIIFAVTLSPAIYYLLIKKRKPGPAPSLAPTFNPNLI